jgi:SAM-dependent methyltransferase
MTFAHKIGKLFTLEFYRRMWRHLDRILFPIPLKPFLARIDQERLRELRARHGSRPLDSPDRYPHYDKYLDLDTYLPLNLRRLRYLQLDRAKPKDILDIGCGAGYFLFVAQVRGHRGLGLDTGEVPLFDDLLDLLGVERVIGRIRLREPMPSLGRRFDLITAFSPAFHGGKDTSWDWNAPAWDYLITDLERHLKPGGQIFFGLNPAYGGEFYTPEMLALFRRRHARIDRENILFPPKPA